MDTSLILQYVWVLIILVGLEGILAADNALVMAIMVKHLPDEQRKKALFYGLAGAFVFRLGSLFLISLLVGVWQVQAVGAIYLIFLAVHHLLRKSKTERSKKREEKAADNQSGFWMTVLKVELADIAFAVDSILAAVALVVSLPDTPLPRIGGMDGGKFLVIFLGGFIGLILIRFAAGYFVRLLHRRPKLESAAYLVVGWVGVKLAVYTLAHHEIGVIPEAFVESTLWKLTFWGVLLTIFIGGWFLSSEKKRNVGQVEEPLDEIEEIEKTDTDKKLR